MARQSALKVRGIVVHCTASVFGDAAQVRQWHKARGWSDCGYHAVILNGVRKGRDPYALALDGKIEPGRPETRQGAHCAAQGMNSCTLGVSLVGSPGKGAPAGATAAGNAADPGALQPGCAYATRRQLEALAHYLAVKCDAHGLDPLGTFTHPATGRRVNVISQHSDHDPGKPFCASLVLGVIRAMAAQKLLQIQAQRETQRAQAAAQAGK